MYRAGHSGIHESMDVSSSRTPMLRHCTSGCFVGLFVTSTSGLGFRVLSTGVCLDHNHIIKNLAARGLGSSAYPPDHP